MEILYINCMLIVVPGGELSSSCQLMSRCEDRERCDAMDGCASAVSGPATPDLTSACCNQFQQAVCDWHYMLGQVNIVVVDINS